MKTTNSVLVVIVILCLIGLSSCGHRHHNGGTSNTNQYEHHYSGGGGCSRGRSGASKRVIQSPTVYQPIYFTQNIEVHQNISFQEALYKMDPSAKELEQKYDVGGTKLIAEMSADAHGIYCSREPYQDVNINILSLEQLKLYVDYSKTSVYQQIINQQIIINDSKVGFRLMSIVEDIINALLTDQLIVHLTLVNITNKSVVCEIKQGQMLEAVKENVQNLVVAESYRFAIAAHQQTSVKLHVYCAAHHRRDPSGSQVRFTPYILNASSSVYDSQSSVWNYIENGY